jgi:signal transduction histidine kinase
MLVALAAAAGFAIDNARLYERKEQQRQWGQAISELTRSLLESPTENGVFTPLVERACALADARLCAISLEAEDGGSFVRALHSSDGPSGTDATFPPAWPALVGEAWSEVLGSGVDLLLVPGPQPGVAQRVAADLAAAAGKVAGPTAVLPLAAGLRAIGHLLLMWDPGQEDAASQVMPDLSAFAQQVALGLIAARAHHDKALVAMLEDRDRIARDMHDLVIQRLFATGLSLQAAGRFAVHPMVQNRLDEAVESLDMTIKEIRSTIFDLHAKAATGAVESQLREVLETYTPSLGFSPALDLRGDLTLLDAGVAVDLMAVVREGISNVSRHAEASTASVQVAVGASLRVAISDDGKGISDSGRRSGLANLERRATARSGTFEIEPLEPSGTRLTWSVPLSE